MNEPVSLTIGEHTATYTSAHEAIVALLKSLPRKKRQILRWMETLRQINQDEAGIERKGKPEGDERAVVGESTLRGAK